MSQKNNLRNFFLRVSLCFFGLVLGFSIFSREVSLQDSPVAKPTPRPTAARASTNTNAAANTVRMTNGNVVYYSNGGMIANNYVPAPPPPANSIVRGRVFYEDTGRPVKRSSIMLIGEKVEGGPSSELTALTDDGGFFQMKNVRAGTYYAMVSAPGVVSPLAYFDFSTGRDGGGREKEAMQKAFAGFDKIIVDGVTNIDVQIPARRGGAIGGRVMYDDGDAAIGVKIEVLRKVENKFMSVLSNFSALLPMMMGGGGFGFQTDDRGVYRFSGLPAGEYVVKVTETTSHSENSEKSYYDIFEGVGGGKSFLTVFYPDVFDAKSAQVISVLPGQEIPEINLTIPSRKLHKVEGKLVAKKDKTPVKARITIARDGDENTFSFFDEIGGGRRQQAALTDESGNWKFKDLPKGSYTLTIEPIENEADYQISIGNYSYANFNAMMNSNMRMSNSLPSPAPPPKPKLTKKVQKFTIEDNDLTEIIVELGYGATISGVVSVENGRDFPQSVSIVSTNETEESASASVGTSEFNDGGGVQRIVKNDFKLENVPEGKTQLLIYSADDDFYVKSAIAGGADLLASPFELKEGEVLRNVQIVLGKDVGTLKGTVLDGEKEAVDNLQFTLVPVDAVKRRNNSFYRTTTTFGKGEFEVKAAPGEYSVVFIDKNIGAKKQGEFDKWLDEAMKDAQTVKIEAGRTETITIKKAK